MRGEVPHLVHPPSHYVKRNFWYTTQPMEEPSRPEDLRRTFDWVGWDRLLFSTDYPHWDQDDPAYAFNIKLTPAERRQICHDNAKQFTGSDHAEASYRTRQRDPAGEHCKSSTSAAAKFACSMWAVISSRCSIAVRMKAPSSAAASSSAFQSRKRRDVTNSRGPVKSCAARGTAGSLT